MSLNQQLQEILSALTELEKNSRSIKKLTIQKDIRKIKQWLSFDEEERLPLPDVDFDAYGFSIISTLEDNVTIIEDSSASTSREEDDVFEEITQVFQPATLNSNDNVDMFSETSLPFQSESNTLDYPVQVADPHIAGIILGDPPILQGMPILKSPVADNQEENEEVTSGEDDNVIPCVNDSQPIAQTLDEDAVIFGSSNELTSPALHDNDIFGEPVLEESVNPKQEANHSPSYELVDIPVAIDSVDSSDSDVFGSMDAVDSDIFGSIFSETTVHSTVDGSIIEAVDPQKSESSETVPSVQEESMEDDSSLPDVEDVDIFGNSAEVDESNVTSVVLDTSVHKTIVSETSIEEPKLNWNDESLDMGQLTSFYSAHPEDLLDEDNLQREREAERKLQEALLFYHQGNTALTERHYGVAKDQLELAQLGIADALKVLPTYEEAQRAQQRVLQVMHEVRYHTLLERLRDEKDVRALDETIVEARGYLSLIVSEEHRRVFEQGLAVGLERSEVIRREQGQTTSILNLRNLLQVVIAVGKVQALLDDPDIKTIYSAESGEMVMLEDYYPTAVTNRDTLALRTFYDIRSKATLFVPEIGFRHPLAALDYLGDRIYLGLLNSIDYLERGFSDRVIHKYWSESDGFLKELFDTLNQIGISRKNQDLLKLLLRCWKENRLVDDYEIGMDQKVFGASDAVVEDAKQILRELRGSQKKIQWDSSDSLKWLFSTIKIEQIQIDDFTNAINTWFEQEMRIQQDANGKVLFAVLPANSRDEIKGMVADWTSQGQRWKEAQAFLESIPSLSNPIEQFQALGKAREKYPHHADLPQFEELVLTALPPQLSSSIQDVLKEGRQRLAMEAEDACKQRLTGSQVTEVEQIAGFAETFEQLKVVDDAIGMFNRVAKDIINSAQERNGLIQAAFTTYMNTDDKQHNIKAIYQQACDGIVDVANRSNVEPSAKKRLQDFRNEAVQTSLVLLNQDGGQEYSVSEAALNLEKELLVALDGYLWQELQKEIADQEIPSFIIADMQEFLDRLNHVNEILTQNHRDYHRANAVLTTLEATRVDVESLQTGELAEFRRELVQAVQRRKDIRAAYQQIELCLNRGEIPQAYGAYQDLQEAFRLDPEIHFLYENNIQPSLNEDDLLLQAKSFYNSSHWLSCQNTSKKIQNNPALAQEARILEDLCEMHILAEHIDQLWYEEKYAVTMNAFNSLENLSKRGEQQEVLFADLSEQYFIASRQQALHEKRKTDEENGVSTRLEDLFVLLPEMKTYLEKPQTTVDCVGHEYERVDYVDTALNEIKAMLKLDTSRLGELKAWKLWLEGNAYKQFSTRLSFILDAGQADVEYGYHIAMVAHRQSLLLSSEIRRLCRLIFIRRNEIEDERLRNSGQDEDFIDMVENWEAIATLLPNDLDIPELLNLRRREALIGFLDNALTRLVYQEVFDTLDCKRNPINPDLPSQPCVGQYTRVPFAFLVDTDEELSIRRTSANALQTAQMLYDQGHYRQVIDYLENSIKDLNRSELISQKEILGKKMIQNLQMRAQENEELIPKASAYAQILRLTDQGAPALLAKQFIDEHKQQLSRIIKTKAELASEIIVVSEEVESQLEQIFELESELDALVPVLDQLDLPQMGKDNIVINAIIKLGQTKQKLEYALQAFTHYDKANRNNGWQRCLYSGNWEALESELQTLRVFLPETQVELVELSERYKFTQEQRRKLTQALTGLKQDFDGGNFASALTHCDTINNILKRNDPVHDPPVDIYNLVRDNFEIFDNYDNTHVPYFKKNKAKVIQEVLKARQKNFEVWEEFSKRIKGQLDEQEGNGDYLPTPLELPFDPQGEKRKTEMEKIRSWIFRSKSFLEEFAVVPPGAFDSEIFIDEHASDPPVETNLPFPNNFVSDEIVEEMKETWENSNSNYKLSLAQFERYKEFEKNVNHQIDTIIRLVQEKQYDQAREELPDPREFYQDWSDYRLSVFLQHLGNLSQ